MNAKDKRHNEDGIIEFKPNKQGAKVPFFHFPVCIMDTDQWKSLSTSARLSYFALRTFSDAYGSAVRCSYGQVADRAGFTRRSAHRGVSELIESGFITRIGSNGAVGQFRFTHNGDGKTCDDNVTGGMTISSQVTYDNIVTGDDDNVTGGMTILSHPCDNIGTLLIPKNKESKNKTRQRARPKFGGIEVSESESAERLESLAYDPDSSQTVILIWFDYWYSAIGSAPRINWGRDGKIAKEIWDYLRSSIEKTGETGEQIGLRAITGVKAIVGRAFRAAQYQEQELFPFNQGYKRCTLQNISSRLNDLVAAIKEEKNRVKPVENPKSLDDAIREFEGMSDDNHK